MCVRNPNINKGYDYETAFAKRAQRINELFLQTSLKDDSKERDKKSSYEF
jgi:hypothetical protein